jgi:hypothetical protein
VAGAYTEEELGRLDEIGGRRTAVALTDIRQLHLTDDYGEQIVEHGDK